MKRDLDTLLLMPDKKTPMTFGQTGLALTLGLMIAEAAISMFPNEDPLPDAGEKSMRFKLSLRCELGGVQEFNKKELDCILRCCNMKCGTWLYGQVAAWAEGVNPWGAQVVAEIRDEHLRTLPEDEHEDQLDAMIAHEDVAA